MPHPFRLVPAVALVVAATVTMVGCSAAWEPRVAPDPVGAVASGFIPSQAPSPEATVHPPADSWGDLRPARGYRVVLLTAGDDEPTTTIVQSVRDWAGEHGVDLRTVTAEADVVPAAIEAMDMHPDLIVIAGNDLIDPMAIITANHLDQQFLVVGAELAEPTGNVTAADWTGASFRGEGLGAASSYDPASFTPERTDSAIRAGAAAVLSGMTGIVVWVD